MSVRDLARELRPGSNAPDVGRTSSDIVASVGMSESPPVLYLENRGPTAFLGSPRDYHVGDVVEYISDGPGSIVLGKLTKRGYGPVIDDPDEAEDMPEWVTPTLAGSWVQYVGSGGFETPGYYVQGDYWCRLKGVVASGSGTIFTLPEGARPAFRCHFTVATAGGVAKVRVQTDGQVVYSIGGNNTWLSLDGITFPTAWNRAAWLSPYMLNGWNGDAGEVDGDPAIFVRSDGWCWMKGAVDNGPGSSEVMILPEAARSNKCDSLSTIGLGINRLDIGGGAGSTDRNAGTVVSRGGSTGFIVGGASWWNDQAISNDPFTVLTPINGWSNYGLDHRILSAYRDHFNVVHLMGLLDGTSKSSSTIVNLPVGYRPGSRQLFKAIKDGAADAQVEVAPSGDVISLGHTTGYFALGQISFRATQ